MTWEFATAGRILFGPGTAEKLPAAMRELGHRPLLVTGRRLADAARLPDPVSAIGQQRGAFAATVVIDSEPTVDLIRAGVATFRDAGCDLVVGIGGGSVLDSAKAIALLATNSGEPLDYLEIIGRGQTPTNPPVPCIAVPTTAGTGSEVTRNAVLGSPTHRRKASLRHPSMLPRLAIVDPQLTLTLPRAITASTGLDALTQLIEPYVSARATPITDAICLDGIARVARSLRTAASSQGAASPDGAANLDARTDMSLASLFGGLALANAGLGVVHGFAAPIGGMFPAPHGAVCAALLPHGMATNLRALHARSPSHPAIDRYRRVAVAFTGDATASAEDGIAAVAALCADLEIPPLRTYGIGDRHVAEICEEARRASSMKVNPIELTDEELRATLTAAL
jgi:alcohol dehydrogenase class IV